MNQHSLTPTYLLQLGIKIRTQIVSCSFRVKKQELSQEVTRGRNVSTQHSLRKLNEPSLWAL